MSRPSSPAWLVPAAVLAAAVALPASAQTTVGPESAQSDTAANAAASVENAAPAAADAVAQPPPAPVDPLLAAIRERAGSARGNVIAADRAAMAAFYEKNGAPIWVTPEGFTARAGHAIAEIAMADDWGLEARAFDLPQLPSSGPLSIAALADAEVALSLAVLRYARYARGGRLEPTQLSRNLDQKPTLRDPKVVMEAVAATDTPSNYLRDLHPKHAQFQLLRQALLKARGQTNPPEEEKEPAVRIPKGPTLKVGMKHPQVGLLRKRLELASNAEDEDVFDRDVQEAVKAFQKKSGIQETGSLTSNTRSALNGGDRPRSAKGSEVQRIVLNMERWRWMPEHLGEFHVWNNIPEYQSRVVKNGRTIHQTKIIVGKPDTQTAVFSADMRHVVFGPEWGVPDSIKVKEILPYLRPSSDFFGWGGGTDTRVLQRHNLRVSYNGRPVDASQVDWTRTDIRRYTFIQPAGPTNVLGAIKFRFPNKHDIYMHDTPQRNLFGSAARAFSHGCIRTQNPGQFAEIVLEEDKGWSAAHVRQLYARGGNNEVTLTKNIPVHNTYFTAVVGDDGRVQTFADFYGHDQRVAAALAGRPVALEEPSVASAPPREREARRPKAYKQTSNDDFFTGLFGN